MGPEPQHNTTTQCTETFNHLICHDNTGFMKSADLSQLSSSTTLDCCAYSTGHALKNLGCMGLQIDMQSSQFILENSVMHVYEVSVGMQTSVA